MWNRYTERARRAIYDAQEEAARCEERVVRIEHLLSGILTRETTVAARVLVAVGCPREQLIERLTPLMLRGPGRVPTAEMNLDSTAKRAIDHATDEAKRLGNDWIGTEHLLLGTITAEQDPTRQLFRECAINADDVRAALATISASHSAVAAGGPPEARHLRRGAVGQGLSWLIFTENTSNAILHAQREAARLGGNVVWPEHLLLGVLRAESGMSHRLIAAFGVTPNELLRELEPIVSRGPAHDAEREMQLHPSARAILEGARQQAIRGESTYVGTDHLLIAIVATAGEPSASLFRTRGISADRLRSALDDLYPSVWSASSRQRTESAGRPTSPASAPAAGPVRVHTRPQPTRRATRRVGILVLIILLGLIALLMRLLLS